MSLLVYCAGPFTSNQLQNTKAAAAVAHRLLAAGFNVHLPHAYALTEAMSGLEPASYEVWMERCFRMLRRCDCLLRMPGQSAGADREVQFARQLGLPVFYDEFELLRAARRPAAPDPNCPHPRTYHVGLWPKCADCGAWRD